MANYKKLLSDSVVYGLSSIVGRFLNYLLVPVYTYHMAAASGGYGIVTNVYAYVALLLVILTFGMETTYFYYANKQGIDPRKAFATALTAVAFVSLSFVVLVWALIDPVSAAVGYASHPEYIRIMSLVVAVDAFQAILFARLRQEGHAWKFASLKLAYIGLSVLLTLFIFLLAPRIQHLGCMAWYNESDQVAYIFYINLICQLLVFLGFVPELRSIGRNAFDSRLLLQMLRYTWPLLLFGIAGMLNNVADKILYPKLVPGPEGHVQLGIYGACVKIAMIMSLITQAFRYAYEPFVFGGGKDGKSKESQATVMKYFVIFTLLAGLAVVCYLDVLRYFVDDDYWAGLKVIPIVMLAEIFMGIYFNLSFWYKLTERTWWGAIMSAVGCAVLVAVNVVFVPRIGFMACAWGGVAGYGVCVLLSYFIGQHYYPVNYPLKTIGGYFALALILFAAVRLWQPAPLGWRLAYNTLLLLVYVAVLLFSERHLVKRVAGSLKSKILNRHK